MRKVVRLQVKGSNYVELRSAAEAKMKLLLGEEAELPFDAEFDISESSEMSAEGGQVLRITWEADVTVRTSDSSFKTTT